MPLKFFKRKCVRKVRPVSQSRKIKKASFKYLFIAYGIASVIAIIVVLMYDKKHPTTSGTNHPSAVTKTSGSSRQSTELALQKLSNEIVSSQLSESESEKLTIEAFQKYYSMTAPKSNDSSADAIEWSEIHDNLLSAVQYAKSNNFTLMQSAWQGIGQELSALGT